MGITVLLIVLFSYHEEKRQNIRQPLDILGIVSLPALLLFVLAAFANHSPYSPSVLTYV